MRLFTHNFLQCHAKECIESGKNFPLILELEKVFSSDDNLKEEPVSNLFYKSCEYNEQFIKNQLNRLDYKTLIQAANNIGIKHDLPVEKPESTPLPKDFLKEVHRVCMEFYIENGWMQCQNCGHCYLIRDGIPNMLLHQDELIDGDEKTKD